MGKRKTRREEETRESGGIFQALIAGDVFSAEVSIPGVIKAKGPRGQKIDPDEKSGSKPGQEVGEMPKRAPRTFHVSNLTLWFFIIMYPLTIGLITNAVYRGPNTVPDIVYYVVVFGGMPAATLLAFREWWRFVTFK